MQGATRSTSRAISPETALLLCFCLLDTLTSAYFFQRGQAVEGNPLLRTYADAGLMSFLGAKLFTFVPTLIFMEILRRSRPRFTAGLLRVATWGYAAVYALFSLPQFLR